MKKTAVILAAALLAAALAAALFSCGRRYEDEEIISAAEDLIVRSEEINRIYFGEGIPLADEEDFADLEPWLTPDLPPEDGANEENGLTYYMVKPGCGYASIEDIKNATLRVFTEDYSAILFENAFSGVTVVVGDGDRAERQVVSLARYIDAEEGYLAARIPSEDEKLPLGRVYDLEKITVVSQRGTEAKIKVPSTSPEGEAEEIELTLKMTADGWRLDTPTY
ncbi:MAG: hypothetical protein IJK58_08225 [Clostridia bacterium]|nr:hypothetical protein [Clostridia bacterium]